MDLIRKWQINNAWNEMWLSPVRGTGGVNGGGSGSGRGF